MWANGFNPKLLAELVLAGLATAETETVRAGGPPMKVERYFMSLATLRFIILLVLHHIALTVLIGGAILLASLEWPF
jgi:hypothetical protein